MPDMYSAAAAAAMNSQATRAKMVQVADRIAGTARSLAAAEKVALSVTRESGTRPKGRPYERVKATSTSTSEWGRQSSPRRRILGRAAAASAGRTSARRGDRS